MASRENKSNLLEDLFGVKPSGDNTATKSVSATDAGSSKPQTALDRLLGDDLALSSAKVSRYSTVKPSINPSSQEINQAKPIQTNAERHMSSARAHHGGDVVADQQSLHEQSAVSQPSWMYKLGLISASHNTAPAAVNSPPPAAAAAVSSLASDNTVLQTVSQPTLLQAPTGDSSVMMRQLIETIKTLNTDTLNVLKHSVSSRLDAVEAAHRANEQVIRAEINRLKINYQQPKLSEGETEQQCSVQQCSVQQCWVLVHQSLTDINCTVQQASLALSPHLSALSSSALDDNHHSLSDEMRAIITSLPIQLDELSHKTGACHREFTILQQKVEKQDTFITDLKCQISRANDDKESAVKMLEDSLHDLRAELSRSRSEAEKARAELKSARELVTQSQHQYQQQHEHRQQIHKQIEASREQLLTEQKRWMRQVDEARHSASASLAHLSLSPQQQQQQQQQQHGGETEPARTVAGRGSARKMSWAEVDGVLQAIADEKKLLQQRAEENNRRIDQKLEEVEKKSRKLQKEKQKLYKQWQMYKMKVQQVDSFLKTAECMREEGSMCMKTYRQLIAGVQHNKQQMHQTRCQLNKQHQIITRDRLRLFAEKSEC